MFISNLLRSFIVTANNKSIKDSAKQLFITESPLSRRIKILEDKLGCSLFLRGRDGISLTKEGQAIYNAILPYYNDMAMLENAYLSKCDNVKKKQEKNKFNIAVEFGIIDFISELSYFNLDAIDALTCNYFHGNITSKLLNTNADIILSTNSLLYDNSIVTCFPYVGLRINIVKAKSIKTNNIDRIIMSGPLSNYLNHIQGDWCEDIIKRYKLHEDSEIITVHDIMDYRADIENGKAIAVVYQKIKDPLLNHFHYLNFVPLKLNDYDVKININMYFLNKNKSQVMKNFIEPLGSV